MPIFDGRGAALRMPAPYLGSESRHAFDARADVGEFFIEPLFVKRDTPRWPNLRR